MRFNGVDPGLTILSYGTRQKTKKIYDEYGSIPNTSVEYFIDNEEYIGYEREMIFLIKNEEELRTAFELFNGAGKLEVGDGGYYKARVIETEHEFISRDRTMSQFIVTFRIAPFFWIESSNITITPPGIVYNSGYKSYPLIRVYGTGDLTVTINGRATVLLGVDEYIDLDSELRIAYKGTINQGEKLISDFPFFDSGKNTVSADGASSLGITPRWREL